MVLGREVEVICLSSDGVALSSPVPVRPRGGGSGVGSGSGNGSRNDGGKGKGKGKEKEVIQEFSSDLGILGSEDGITGGDELPRARTDSEISDDYHGGTSGAGKKTTTDKPRHRFEDPISSWDLQSDIGMELERELEKAKNQKYSQSQSQSQSQSWKENRNPKEIDTADISTPTAPRATRHSPSSRTPTARVRRTATGTPTTTRLLRSATRSPATPRPVYTPPGARRRREPAMAAGRVTSIAMEEVIVIEDTPEKLALDKRAVYGKSGVGRKGVVTGTTVEEFGFSPGTRALLDGILGKGGNGARGSGEGGDDGGKAKVKDKKKTGEGAKRLSVQKAGAKKRNSGGGIVGVEVEVEPGAGRVSGGAAEVQNDSGLELDLDPDLDEVDEVLPAATSKRRRISKESGAVTTERIPAEKPSRSKPADGTKASRARNAAEKAAEKEAAKEAKRLQKEAKQQEKQREAELATVNKLKTSKKESVREMIADISSPFSTSPAGLQLQRFLGTQECEFTTDWASPVPNVVKWRRKVTAEMDERLGYYVPIREKVKEENHILVVIQGEEFVDLGDGLDGHVASVKGILGNGKVKPIYLIEGLTALLRKSKNAKNRNFQGAVRQAIGGSSGGAGGRARGGRRKSGTRDFTQIDEDVVEDQLLRLQITHGCLIHHTATMQETSEWISVFTRDISFIPYKERLDFGLSFCTDVGQVKTGVDAKDTFFRMLQEITRVTAGVANGIMAEYQTVGELVAALKADGEEAVADIPMANSVGASSGRAIGVATSKRIYRIFMGMDPLSADV